MQLLGGFVVIIGVLPQIVQIIKTKSVNDLNLRTYIMVCSGLALMEVYAVYKMIYENGVMLFITSTLSLLVNVLIMILIAIYKPKEKSRDQLKVLKEEFIYESDNH